LFILLLLLLLYCFPQTAGSQVEEDAQSESNSDIPADRKMKKSNLLDKISAQTIKQILELLCDESVSEGRLIALGTVYVLKLSQGKYRYFERYLSYCGTIMEKNLKLLYEFASKSCSLLDESSLKHCSLTFHFCSYIKARTLV